MSDEASTPNKWQTPRQSANNDESLEPFAVFGFVSILQGPTHRWHDVKETQAGFRSRSFAGLAVIWSPIVLLVTNRYNE